MKPSSLRYRFDHVVHAWRRRRTRGRIERLYRELVATWDQAAFRQQFRDLWDPFETVLPAKFLNLEVWLREAIFRYQLLALPDGRPLRVLDIGAGTGYFLLVCRHQGHQVLGLDLPGEPLYDRCFEFFALPRIEHRIEPGQPLPDTGPPLDLVTAYMTCFNYDARQQPWDVPPWQALLRDLRGRLRQGGRVVLKFNLEPGGLQFCSPAVTRALTQAPGFRCRYFLDYALLKAV
ncbi:MAG: methyltransferase domain-containing protein [Pirellulaceae bacterium]|nr:methyltransferase domain-containing protein [Pirellulaceae bacterium]